MTTFSKHCIMIILKSQFQITSITGRGSLPFCSMDHKKSKEIHGPLKAEPVPIKSVKMSTVLYFTYVHGPSRTSPRTPG